MDTLERQKARVAANKQRAEAALAEVTGLLEQHSGIIFDRPMTRSLRLTCPGESPGISIHIDEDCWQLGRTTEFLGTFSIGVYGDHRSNRHRRFPARKDGTYNVTGIAAAAVAEYEAQAERIRADDQARRQEESCEAQHAALLAEFGLTKNPLGYVDGGLVHLNANVSLATMRVLLQALVDAGMVETGGEG